MVTAQYARFVLLACTILVAALVFTKDARAASGNTQICQPSSSCKVGEFLYDDTYTPITNATCTITSRYPDGTIFLNSQAMTAAADGWYSNDFTAPSILGLYRTEVRCVTGADTLALDKSFEVAQTSTLSQGDVASAVWNASKSSYSGANTFGVALQNAVPSASDVASSVWGYSSRTLSGFGTLVSDIWANSTRTLTGADLSSGSLATKTDVTGSTTITNINNITNETRNLLEQLVNKPIIESSFETSSSFDLQTKLDTTRSKSEQLVSSTSYIKSKNALLVTKWGSLKEADISNSLTESSKVFDSILAQAGWLMDEWGWKTASDLYTQANTTKIKLISIQKTISKTGKTTSTQKEIKTLSSSFDKLDLLIGKSTDSSTKKTIYGNTKSVVELADNFTSKSSQASDFLAHWQDSKVEPKKINDLSKDLASINKLSKLNNYLLAKVSDKDTEKNLKNKVLGLRGVAETNKMLLAKKPEKGLSNTWLELGSIVFKTVITNPSKSISQTVPLKYNLPEEVKKENIISIDDGLTVQFDAEKNIYYIKGEFTLAPSETKTVSITVDDNVFVVSEIEIQSIKKQAEDLSKVLGSNSPFFAQGVTLKSDIDVSLAKAETLQKQAITPEAKIRAYREAMIEINAAKGKVDKLKDLATEVSSSGSFLGFVGGTQAIAVWGLIIIMAAGFVFLALYMRMLRSHEQKTNQATDLKISPKKKKVEKSILGNDIEVEPEYNSSERINEKNLSFEYKAKKFPKALRLAIAFIVFGAITAVISGIIVSRVVTAKNSNQETATSKSEEYNSPVTKAPESSGSAEKASDVLGIQNNTTDNKQSPEKPKTTLFVPSGLSVSLYKEPNISSAILSTFYSSRDILQVEAKDYWVKVKVDNIEGWVDKDFIETKSETAKPQGGSVQNIKISETPTGFLRVRETPGGKEITQVYPDSEFPMIGEDKGWIQISLLDGTLGWVSKQYTKQPSNLDPN